MQPYDHGEVWTILTAAEARQLANHLLTQAGAAERESAATLQRTGEGRPGVPWPIRVVSLPAGQSVAGQD
jgi:hypothetical protein